MHSIRGRCVSCSGWVAGAAAAVLASGRTTDAVASAAPPPRARNDNVCVVHGVAPQYQLILQRQRCAALGDCRAKLYECLTRRARSRACRRRQRGVSEADPSICAVARRTSRGHGGSQTYLRRKEAEKHANAEKSWGARRRLLARRRQPPVGPTYPAARELTEARNETQTLATKCEGLEAGACVLERVQLLLRRCWCEILRRW